ncbi:lipoprotein [Bosea sp. TWI1241]|uniref:LPS translocon maturation chaperone LptM n=1 Tax=Bosea sp. TWI1241 TaxID=3148904 RepID=UPI0032081FD0
MPHTRLTFGRALLMAGLLGLALSACGRRGPLEPPPDSKTAIDLPDKQTGATENVAPDPTSATPLGRPAKRNRPIEIPDKPFLLDPLL